MSKNVPTIETSNQNGHASSSKIDLIKELIFGEKIEEYDSEFEKLKTDIEQKRKELNDLITDVRLDLENTLDTISTDLNIRITNLEENLGERLNEIDADKVTKKSLGDLLITLGKKISSE